MIEYKKTGFFERLFGGRPTRRQLVTAAAALLLIAAVALCLTAKNGGDSAASAQPMTGAVIIIDPGHGGVDGGAVGVGGTVEKRINLEISLRLREVLTRAGYTVIMTRDTDISIHDSTAGSIREKKVSDMKNRLKLTQLYPDSLLVSIHQNTLDSPSVTGAQVFYSPNAPESQLLAQTLQNVFNDSLQPDSHREIKKAGKNLYLFYNAKNTAILAECGFLSNAGEESMLCDPAYQDKIVYCLFTGIAEYLAGTGNAAAQA